MKNFLLLFTILFVFENIYSQNISLENNDITIEIKHESNDDTTLIILKNHANKRILISNVGEVNFDVKYIGIGLYSSVFPYSPDHLSKYIGKLKMIMVDPNSSIVFKEKSKSDLLLGDLDFSLDYIVQNDNIKFAHDSLILIDRASYDKSVKFLKFKINKK